MRITFEAVNIRDLILQMEHVIASVSPRPEVSAPQAPGFGTVPKAIVQEARPPIVDKPVEKPVYTQITKSVPVEKKPRSEKQLANDEKMRVAALEKIAARKAAKAAAVEKQVAEPPIVEKLPDPFVQEPGEVDPAEIVRIRLKAIEELQAAYANGYQKEVMELLSRFGNGAKSFRELPPEAFPEIRKAIDLGALT